MRPLIFLAATLGLGALIHGLAMRAARRIRSNPDAIPYDELRQEPAAEERFIERPDGARIRVCVAGSGPTVVFAHGYGVALVEWNLIWNELQARGRRCVAFDMRGHGRSTIGSQGIDAHLLAGDYLAVLEALDIEDAVLVGHSMGGFLGIWAMLEHEGVMDRLRGFVTIASSAGDVLRGSPQNRLQSPLVTLGVIQAVVASPTYSWVFGASLCGDVPSPAMIRAFSEVFAEQPHRKLAPLQHAMARTSFYDRLHEICVPTVVMCGELDRTSPRWHSEQLGVRIPDARNVWLPNRGHVLNWEAPAEIVEAIESLLAPAS